MKVLGLTALKEDKKVFWSPSVEWVKNDGEVRIEMFSYPDYIADLFPKFYFLTQKGILVNELINEFPTLDSKKLNNFIKDLLKKRILVDTILSPQEVFYPQTHLFKNDYSEDILFNAEELEKFKMKQLNRTCEVKSNLKIKLNEDVEYPSMISERRTYRTFDTEHEISFKAFSELLSIFKQIRKDDKVYYYYASGGALYPLDVYIYVKPNRVENVKAGLYYYSPIDNSLNLVSSTCVITEDAHYFTNKEIFNESAFSVFLIYNAEATMPKYGGMGYFYSCIDSGIMVGALTQTAELSNIGLCSIGDMNFKKIEKYFKLNKNQVHIHTIEGGLKPKK